MSCCAKAGCLRPEGWWHMYEIYMDHFANPSLSVVVAKFWLFRFAVLDSTYVFSLYCNPHLDHCIFDCLLTSMAAVQAEDVCAACLFPVCG